MVRYVILSVLSVDCRLAVPCWLPVLYGPRLGVACRLGEVWGMRSVLESARLMSTGLYHNPLRRNKSGQADSTLELVRHPVEWGQSRALARLLNLGEPEVGLCHHNCL